MLRLNSGMNNAALAALCLALAWGPAHGAMTENLATSVTAMSLGNAVTADPPGIESIHFNPAGLARLEGKNKTDSFFAARFRAWADFKQPDGFSIGGWKNDPLAGTQTSTFQQSLYVPFHGVPGTSFPLLVGAGLGFSYQPENSRFTFATATYLPQAVGFTRTDDEDPARFDGRMAVIQRFVYLAPSVGFKLSDTVSVGVAVPVAHQAFALDTDMRTPNDFLGIVGKLQEGFCPENGGNPIDMFLFGLCSGGKEGRLNPFKKAARMQLDATAPVDLSMNAGVLWEPYDWISLGAVYRGGSDAVLRGTYRFDTEPMLREFAGGLYKSLLGPLLASMFGIPPNIPPVQEGNMTMVLPHPRHIQVGVALKPTRWFQLNVDANYARWGDWDKLKIKFDQTIHLLEMLRLFGQPDPTTLNLPRGYKSVVHFGYGLTLRPTNWFALRFGYEPRKSSIPTNALDLIAPLPDLNIYSFGFQIKFDSGTDLNFGASYTRGKFNLPANTSCALNCDKFFNVLYNPYAGLDVKGGNSLQYMGITINQKF